MLHFHMKQGVLLVEYNILWLQTVLVLEKEFGDPGLKTSLKKITRKYIVTIKKYPRTTFPLKIFSYLLNNRLYYIGIVKHFYVSQKTFVPDQGVVYNWHNRDKITTADWKLSRFTEQTGGLRAEITKN